MSREPRCPIPLASEGMLSSWSTPWKPCVAMSPAAGDQAKSENILGAGGMGTWSLLSSWGTLENPRGNMSPAAVIMPGEGSHPWSSGGPLLSMSCEK